MSAILSMREIQEQAFAFYQDGKYAEMSDFLTRVADVFSADARFTYYNWQMCATALQGQTERAMQFFREALDAGFWYSEKSLREDADLKSLQGSSEFDRLVKISKERNQEAQAQAIPKLLVLAPENTPTPYPWVITLHGNMSNLDAPTSVDPWRPAVKAGWLLAAAQSSQLRGQDRYVWDDRDWAVREILQHVETLRTQYPIDPAHGVIGGFSLGAGTALWLGLMGLLPVKRVIAVAPWLSAADVAALEVPIAEGKADGLGIFIVVSEYDKDCYAVSCAISEHLKTRGVMHELIVTHDPGHGFPPSFTDTLVRQLANV
ncbi:MAG: alpha/beta hydrolase [Aggregatilineales bacterium]